ncbi:GGDEF domain-containing protein [Actinophytocola xinjiangensis]|uniref:GGDEF domain-containing protein n=1 Tax=Actinophytocola xinjiangensis TaxID=485602 RepID=A0A7Z1AYC4_9PSEU|nr:GGDEF domain-containing protein [Actinophytocola xinjiangensis]OLF11536.1 GGDEF domain-containing protein [Actinophytocola xinjiangensis]
MVVSGLLATTAIVLTTVTASTPVREDWFRFAALAVCASVHLQLSRRQEERRRSRKPTVQIDLVGIWSFAGVVVLPIHLALLGIVLSRTQRWVVARRPLYRFMFSTSSVLLAAVVAHEALAAFGPRTWSRTGVIDSIAEFGILMLAGIVYFSVQAAVIAIGIILLRPSQPTIRTVLGTKDDNELEALTIALGTVAAILLVNVPAALAIIVVVSVIGNRIAEINQLQEAVRTDPKTGLLNIRGWREGAERALSRVERANGSAAVLMVDLDHFKSINDTWGHPAGDDMLEYVAHALRGATRPSDILGRFGGEEFVVFLPDASTDEAKLAGERIRRMISELHVPTTDKRGGPVAITHRTTSIGVAIYPDHAKELGDLLQSADAAVYEAKENGRDQVRIAS